MRRLRCLIMKPALLLAICLLTPALASANVGFFKSVPFLPVPKGAAVILDSGSTNRSGYRIVVQPDGSAAYVSAAGRSQDHIAPELAAKFFADLRRAAPLGDLRRSLCAKSVSFGSSVFVYWSHARSPDLSCPTNALGAAIFKDAAAIAQSLHLEAAFLRPVMRPLMPGEARKPLNPTPGPQRVLVSGR